MSSKIRKLCTLVLTVSATLFVPCWASRAMAASGTFMAVVNESSGNADNRRSITFFDGLDIGAGPLFSVFIPFEIHGSSSNSYEDPSGITVDPNTGDIYLVAFDSGSAFNIGGFDNNTSDPGSPAVDVPDDDDTIADYDIYRLNFNTVYSHWKDNMEGHNLRDVGDPAPDVGGNLPVYTVGMPAGALNDYVTYGVTTPYVDERKLDATHGPSVDGVFDNYNFDSDTGTNPAPSHSNTFVLGDMTTSGGAIEKIGEINRNVYSGSSNFHKALLEFIDEDTLFLNDDARQFKASLNNVANDYDYRMVERVSTSPGAATSANTQFGNGGYNRTTTESWESRQIGQMLLDLDETGASTLSEPQSAEFYDAGSVRGVWVVDRDRAGGGSNPAPDTETGDDIAFLELDSSNNLVGYRQFSNFGGATKFDMLNNPAAPDGFAGKVGQVFVDSDTGDLIVVEEGFTDSINNTPPGPGVSEPAVIRVPVNYDDSGQITLGAWGAKQLLTPAKDTADTFNERGYWSAYDSANDLMFFMSPGEEDGDMIYEPEIDFAADIYVLDLTTGLTTSYLNMDNSISLFFGGNNTDNGNVMVAFTLAAAGLAGDYNGNNVIDAADYTAWRDALTAGATSLLNDPTPGVVDESDFTYWRAHFGEVLGSGAGSGAAAVPEPGSLALLAMGLIGLWGVGRRR